jgi:cytochrome bd-type quinol oxidase subunit 2
MHPPARRYSRGSAVLLGVAVALTVPIVILALQGVGQADALNYIGGLSVPVIGVSLVGSVILSIRGIRRGRRSPVQYAIFAVALCILILPFLLVSLKCCNEFVHFRDRDRPAGDNEPPSGGQVNVVVIRFPYLWIL